MKATNILRKSVHQVGCVYKGLYKDIRPTKHKKHKMNTLYEILILCL